MTDKSLREKIWQFWNIVKWWKTKLFLKVMKNNLSDNFQNEDIDKQKNLNLETLSEYLSQKKYLDSIPSWFKDDYDKILNDNLNKLEWKLKCKNIVMIPAYREEIIILNILKSLYEQKGISKDDYEIIVLVNYPDGQKPMINDYDEQWKLVWVAHFDRTKEVVDAFNKTHKDINISVLEQSFPKTVNLSEEDSKLVYDNKITVSDNDSRVWFLAWIGMARKLLMDIVSIKNPNSNMIMFDSDMELGKNSLKDIISNFDESRDWCCVVEYINKIYNDVLFDNKKHNLNDDQVNDLSKKYKLFSTYGKLLKKYRYFVNGVDNLDNLANSILSWSFILSSNIYLKSNASNILTTTEDTRLLYEVKNKLNHDLKRIVDNEILKFNRVEELRIDDPEIKRYWSHSSNTSKLLYVYEHWVENKWIVVPNPELFKIHYQILFDNIDDIGQISELNNILLNHPDLSKKFNKLFEKIKQRRMIYDVFIIHIDKILEDFNLSRNDIINDVSLEEAITEIWKFLDTRMAW
jgi:hypothetical protein